MVALGLLPFDSSRFSLLVSAATDGRKLPQAQAAAWEAVGRLACISPAQTAPGDRAGLLGLFLGLLLQHRPELAAEVGPSRE